MPLLDLIERHPGVFFGVVAMVFAFNIVAMLRQGWKAEERFEAALGQPVRFRERGASGYSNRTSITKLGGANRTLEVTVTDAELWLKGIWPPFSYIGTRFDLTHRVPLSQIRKHSVSGNTVDLHFVNEEGTVSHVTLMLKEPQMFLKALGL
jgi:hypothetical protein